MIKVGTILKYVDNVNKNYHLIEKIENNTLWYKLVIYYDGLDYPLSHHQNSIGLGAMTKMVIDGELNISTRLFEGEL